METEEVIYPVVRFENIPQQYAEDVMVELKHILEHTVFNVEKGVSDHKLSLDFYEICNKNFTDKLFYIDAMAQELRDTGMEIHVYEYSSTKRTIISGKKWTNVSCVDISKKFNDDKFLITTMNFRGSMTYMKADEMEEFQTHFNSIQLRDYLDVKAADLFYKIEDDREKSALEQYSPVTPYSHIKDVAQEYKNSLVFLLI